MRLRPFTKLTSRIHIQHLPTRTVSNLPSTSSGKLNGQNCIITGGSRGIGLAIAQRFAAEGAASCVLVGRNEGTLAEAVEQLEFVVRAEREAVEEGRAPNHGRREGTVDYRVGDVSKREFWSGLRGESMFKDVDVLVNAAGVTHYSLLMATKAELVEEVVQTNLMGAIWACQTVGKGMARSKKGCIINISSLLGNKGGRGSVAYAASKAGLLGLTRSLAAELGPSNVRVNAILPGYIETQMTESALLRSIDMDPEARTRALDSIPLKRFGRPDEIADAAVFLASNAYAANCILNIDGGLSAT